MNKALLDTNIYSEILKAVNPTVASRVTAYRQTHGLFTLSVITVMEVIQGLQRVNASSRIQTFRNAIASEAVLSSTRPALTSPATSPAISTGSASRSAAAIR